MREKMEAREALEEEGRRVRFEAETETEAEVEAAKVEAAEAGNVAGVD